MNIISSLNFNKSFIHQLFEMADNFKKNNNQIKNVLQGKILINAFFEPSTRTSTSFECAMYRLGGNVISFRDINSSTQKGETFEDTIKTLSTFADVMVLRHPDKHKIQNAITCSSIPIINGGNGNGEHPSQALLDLYSIYYKFGVNFKTKSILFVGDVKNSRTIHSLLNLIHLYPQMKIYFLPYKNLEPSEDMIQKISEFHKQDYSSIVQKWENINYSLFDVVYCTRLQKERTKENNNIFIIDNRFVNKLKKDCIIMHPLPRNEELKTEIDDNPRCFYFIQMECGIYIRMALLNYILNNGK